MFEISKKIIPLYEKELQKLSEEISLYRSESDLWKLDDGIKNSGGNLALHMFGNLNHFIGAVLGKSGYKRNRDLEFSDKNVPREKIISEIEKVKQVISDTLSGISDEEMQQNYPIEFLGRIPTTIELLFVIYGHLTYHLGQLNYHRRLLERQSI